MWLLPFLVTLIMNTATGCCCHGQALVLNAVISVPCFDKKLNILKVLKVKDSPHLSLESSTVAKSQMTAAVPKMEVGVGKWELDWSSWRREKLAGHLKLNVCKCCGVF